MKVSFLSKEVINTFTPACDKTSLVFNVQLRLVSALSWSGWIWSLTHDGAAIHSDRAPVHQWAT